MRSSFKILLVEDTEGKRNRVELLLKRELSPLELHFIYASDYESARERLGEDTFDFVILDIRIPSKITEPSEQWSNALLNAIASGELGFPSHVFGLTAFDDVTEETREYYDTLMFGFAIFDWVEEGWAVYIANKIRYLASAINASETFRLNNYDLDILILTARHDNEFLPIRSVLFGNAPSYKHPIWREASHFGTVRLDSDRALSTALVCVGEMGLSATGAVTSQAIQVLRPRMVVMLGMCAGFEEKGVSILDCIVATESSCWQDGKYEKGRLDPRSKNRNSDLRTIIDELVEKYDSSFGTLTRSFSKQDEFISIRAELGDVVAVIPKVRGGMMLSGSSIVASTEVRAEIELHHGTALGLEMEIYSLYTACARSMGRKPNYFAIKGVADFADGAKKDRAQKLASEFSAHTFLRILNAGEASFYNYPQ